MHTLKIITRSQSNRDNNTVKETGGLVGVSVGRVPGSQATGPGCHQASVNKPLLKHNKMILINLIVIII